MAQYRIDNVAAPIDFECSGEPVKRVLQNCRNLLRARMGEIPYSRYCGFDQALFDLPMPDMRAKLMPELDRLFLYEPAVKVVDASAVLNQNGETVITVILDVNEE